MSDGVGWNTTNSNVLEDITEAVETIRKSSYKTNPKPFCYKGKMCSFDELYEEFNKDRKLNDHAT